MDKINKIIIPITLIGCLIIIIYNFTPLMGLEQPQEIIVSNMEISSNSSESSSSEKSSSKKSSSKNSSSKKSSSKKSSSIPSQSESTITEVDDSNIKLDINVATIEQLIQINGIDENLAISIIEFRDKIGEFFELSELLNVKNMTYEILTQIEDNLYINEKE